MSLSYDRYCAEIVAQTEILIAAIKDADLTVPVPSCPGWNVGQLLRHLGGAHRSAEAITGDGISYADADQSWRDLSAFTNEDPAEVGPWLAAGAAQLSDALQAAGQGAPAGVPVPEWPQTTDFHARRMAHETVIHRADATLALGAGYELDHDVTVDAIDEWMELGCLPFHFEVNPSMRELLGPGRTLHFHATDTADTADTIATGTGTGDHQAAEWVVDLTGDAITWRRAHEKAAVAVRGPLTDLLLLIYRRRSIDTAGVEVIGDRALLEFWHERVSFG